MLLLWRDKSIVSERDIRCAACINLVQSVNVKQDTPLMKLKRMVIVNRVGGGRIIKKEETSSKERK